MRRISLLVLLALCSTQVVAQEEYIPEKEDWFFYDIAHIRLLDGPENFENNIWANTHSLSFMQDILLGKSNFSFAFGFGFTSSNFLNNLRLKTEVVSDEGVTEFTVIPDSVGYDQNKTTVQYFEIPLELRFRSRPNEEGNFFRFYVGGRFGVRFNAYSKYKTDLINVRYYHPEELTRWRAGAYTRIGFDSFSLYGYYSLLDLFDYEMAEDIFANDVDANNMRPVAIGLSLSL